MLFTSGFVLRDGSLFHLLLLPIVVSFGAASRLFAGAGVRLVTDQSYCRPVGFFYLYFFGEGIGEGFFHTTQPKNYKRLYLSHNKEQK